MGLLRILMQLFFLWGVADVETEVEEVYCAAGGGENGGSWSKVYYESCAVKTGTEETVSASRNKTCSRNH
jgi:peptide methionine sulfoxide reductase MsrA